MKYFVTSKISENIKETPEGFLVCIGVPIARTGEMIYGSGETPIDAGKDGKVKIIRKEKEVFRPETIASFEGKPITIKHPPDFVTPENWKDLAKGTLQNVRRGEGENKTDLIADLLITDRQAIDLVKKGLREVSCGYEADYIETGDGEGEQSNIIGNHLALVEEGRAGSGYAIKDHKFKGDSKMSKKKLSDKIKAIWSKAQDEATKVVDEMHEGETHVTDDMSHDELVKYVKDMEKQMAEIKGEKKKEGDQAQGTVVKKSPTAASDDDKKAHDDDKTHDDDAPSLEERVAALEALIAKLKPLEEEEHGSLDDDEYEEGEVTGDDDMCDDDDDDDDKKVHDHKTTDEASRAEILSPGIKADQKDLKLKALKSAYQTKDGKKVIDSLTGGKPDFKSKAQVNLLFVAVSEQLKTSRNSALSQTKRTTDFNFITSQGPISAEKMNEINAKYYSKN